MIVACHPKHQKTIPFLNFLLSVFQNKKKSFFAYFFFAFDLNFFGRVELAIPLRLLKLEGQGRVLSRDPADDASTAHRGNYSSTQRPAFSCQRARRAGE